MIDSPHSSAAEASAPAEEPAEEPAPRYAIDKSWYEAHGLSFEDVVRARMTEATRAQLGSEVTERVPVFDRESGRMQMEERTTVFGSDPIRVIREHDSRSKGFIQRDMSTLEAVFRVLLANGNQPLTVEQIREHLAEWCPGGGCQWLLLPADSLQRLLDRDTHYGFRRREAGAEPEE